MDIVNRSVLDQIGTENSFASYPRVNGAVRLLFVIDSFNLGGTENQCHSISTSLDRTTFQIGVVTFDSSGILKQQFQALDCPIYEVKFKGGYWRMRSLVQIVRLAKIMKGFKPDIVQTFGFYSNIPGILAAKMARVRNIVAGRRFTIPNDARMNSFITPLQDRVDRWLWRYAKRVVVNSSAIRADLVAHGIDRTKTQIIHNGVDYHSIASSIANETENESSTNEVVGMVANFRQQKDHVSFLLAAKCVLGRRPSARFALVGTGPLEEDMRSYARELGISDRVAFLGRQTGSELHNTIRSFSMSVLSSKGNEGMPNVVLEAMAIGKPVIATEVGGTPEIIQDGITGFIIPPCNPNALAQKVLHLLEHPDLIQRMGDAGRARVRKDFTVEQAVKKYETLYNSLVRPQREV